jgi:hypothetical protein
MGDGAAGRQAPSIDAMMVKMKYLFTLFNLSVEDGFFIWIFTAQRL